jgi:hypothetical protein
MTTVKAFADLQGPIAVAYAAVTSQLYTNMAAAATSQAALEKSWL